MSESVRILLGYIICSVYIVFVLLVEEILSRKFRVEKEMARKISHLLSSAIWLICHFFTGPTYHTVIINGVAFVLVAAGELGGKFKSAERTEGDDKKEKGFGMTFFCFSTFVAICITVFAYPQLYPVTGVAYYSLALGDGFAPMGRRIAGKHNIKVFGNKTLAGMIVVFAVSALTALVFSLIFKLGYDALFIISLGALASVAELMGSRGTDNITVEFFVFAYAAMFSFGVVPMALEVTLIAAAPMFVVDSVKNVLTPAANIILFVYLIVSVFCLGYVFLVTAVCLFASEAVVSRITGKLFNRTAGEDAEKHTRDGWQVLVNSVIVLLFTLLYKSLGMLALAFAAFAVLVEEFTDSIASDVGRLSKKQPIDILRFKRIEPGLSGGVSVLGSCAAIVCAAAGAALPFIFFAFDVRAYFVIFGIAVLGMIIDSMLGSSVQALFKCAVCGKTTEKQIHCGSTTELVKGARIINNSMVNLLSAVATAAIAVTIFLCCGIAV